MSNETEAIKIAADRILDPDYPMHRAVSDAFKDRENETRKEPA